MSHQSWPASDPWGFESHNESRVMTSAFAGHSTDISANSYSGVVLSSVAEVRQLRGVARRLMEQDDSMLDPEFFLASLSVGWRPRVVAIHKERAVVGIFYARERVIARIPTGVVYADGSLGGILLANPQHQQRAFRAAAEALLASPAIRSMRLRVLRSSSEFDALQRLTASGSLGVEYLPDDYRGPLFWKRHAHLALADTYDQFLKNLGSTTRHNFRYYRRRFEASGHGFIERLPMDELRSAALDLSPKSKLTARRQPDQIEESMKMIEAARRPLAVGLRHHDGAWVSVIGGWYIPGRAVLRFQCNNERDFGPDSLSIVLRGYLIELLISEGLRELVIWADTGPPLSRYVSYAPTVGVRLDATTRSWRVARAILSTVAPYLPGRLAAAAQWIA